MANNVLREFNRHVRKAAIKPNGTLSIHTLRKSCIQNWANELPINVTEELAGHSSIATTHKYYLQVDEYNRAKAAAVIDSLLVNANAQDEKPEMTDARMTPKANSGQYRDGGQS
jgi:integrase